MVPMNCTAKDPYVDTSTPEHAPTVNRAQELHRICSTPAQLLMQEQVLDSRQFRAAV